MPKGALLHAHLDATVDASYLLSLALKESAIYVRANQTLTSNTFHTVLPEFKALTAELRTNDSKSVTDALYVANSWVPIQTARDNFDPSLGGPEAFDKWVLGAMTINPSEAYGTHNTVTKVARESLSMFTAQNTHTDTDLAKIREHFHRRWSTSSPSKRTTGLTKMSRESFTTCPYTPSTFENLFCPPSKTAYLTWNPASTFGSSESSIYKTLHRRNAST